MTSRIKPERVARGRIVKALSLWQPWASLVGYEKRVETRSWETGYRGPLAILSSKTRDGFLSISPELCAVLSRRCVPERDPDAHPRPDDFPFGSIVCLCRLVSCERMTPEVIAQQTELELATGHWEPGRFAWFLEDFQHVQPPVPCRGAQGLFEIELPEELVS